jgi:hypothetical protein
MFTSLDTRTSIVRIDWMNEYTSFTRQVKAYLLAALLSFGVDFG